MLRWIVDGSLRLRRTVVAVAVALTVFGVWQFRSIHADVLPEFSPPTVHIQTEALGLSAAEVEQLITVPLEQDLLNGVAWLDTIRSESVPGLSSIELIFERGTPIVRARQVVQERLTQAHAIPQVSSPPQMLQPVSSTSRTMIVGLSSQDLSAIDMSVLARWTIRPKLLGVPGVANVAIFGLRERQLQVQVDPARLQQHGVTLDQVIATTGNSLWVSPLTFLEASTPGTGGFIDTPNQRLAVQHVLPIDSPEDLEAVIVEGTAAGSPLRLGDVTSVVQDHQPLIGDALPVEDAASLLVVVDKFPGANTEEVTEGVEDALDALAPGLGGMDIDTSLYRPAGYVDDAGRNITIALAIAGGVGLLVLGLLLWNWRSVAVSATAVAASVVAGGAVLFLFDTTINAVVLAGLVGGLTVLVDDAVVTTETVAREARNGPPTTPRAIGRAVLDARRPLLWAAVIAALVFLPAFFMDDLPGDALLPPVARAYGLALLAATVVGLTVVPAMGSLVFAGDRTGPRPSRAADAVSRGFGWVSGRTWQRPAIMAGAAVVVAAVGAATLIGLDTTVVPSFDERNLLVAWEGAPGTSLPETRRVTALAAAELRSIEGVADAGAFMGRAISADQIVNVDTAQLWVRIDDSADYDGTRDRIEAVLAGYPGVDTELTTYADFRLDDVLGATESPIEVRLYGENQEVLRAKAEEVRDAIAGVDGIVEPVVRNPPLEPTLKVEVDLDAAGAAGIKPGDVRRAAATLLSGIQVGSLFEEQKVFEVVVRGVPATQHSLSAVEDLRIDSPDGTAVRLGDVAQVQLAASPSVINREASAQAMDVAAGVDGRDRGDVAADVEEALDSVSFPLGFHAELRGGYADPRVGRDPGVHGGHPHRGRGGAAAAGRLRQLAPRRPARAAAAGRPDRWPPHGGDRRGRHRPRYARGPVHRGRRRRARCRGDHRPGPPAGREATRATGPAPATIVQAAAERAAPLVLSALTIALAMVPLMFLRGRPGGELVAPLATVVPGGLLTATLVNLFVLPPLYCAIRPAVRDSERDVLDLNRDGQRTPADRERCSMSEPRRTMLGRTMLRRTGPGARRPSPASCWSAWPAAPTTARRARPSPPPPSRRWARRSGSRSPPRPPSGSPSRRHRSRPRAARPSSPTAPWSTTPTAPRGPTPRPGRWSSCAPRSRSSASTATSRCSAGARRRARRS